MTGKERKGKKQESGERLAEREKGMEEGRHFYSWAGVIQDLSLYLEGHQT